MTASAGEAHDGAGRWSLAGPVLAVLLTAAVGGFLAGAVPGRAWWRASA
ncbi:hypothetical protein ACIQWZ_05640 [Streptomyces sp. NPDC098077]